MASITCSKEHMVLTSGSQLLVMKFSEPTKKILFDLSDRTKVDEERSEVKNEEKNEVKCEEKSEEKNEEQKPTGVDPHAPTDRILVTRFSPSGDYFATCTDQKQLTVWTTKPSWAKNWTKTVAKRCMAVTFAQSEVAVFVADKSGDVYRYTVQDETHEGALILGHISMLLDVVVSPDDKLILTAERDEKVRISRLPNAYNIEAFCLGHTEFVSRLAILPSMDVLISGGGDATLRLWDYRKGVELCKASHDWAKSTDESKEEKDPTVTCMSCSDQHRLVAVTLLQHTDVPVYHISRQDGVLAFNEVAQIVCKVPPWALTFDSLGRLWILLPDPAQPLVVYDVEKDGDGCQLIDVSDKASPASVLAKTVQGDWEFLKCSCTVNSIYSGLHKVPFNNLPDYLERKQKRIEYDQSKKGYGKNKQHNPRSKVKISGQNDGSDHFKRTVDDLRGGEKPKAVSEPSREADAKRYKLDS